MKNFFPLLFVCLAPLLKAAVPVTNAPPLQIVMCRDGTDLDALIAEFKLRPKFIYRPLVGLAAPMDAATIERLKVHESVLSVEADGPVSLLGWSGQTNSTGLVRMGVDRFPVARINTVPKAPIDVDVAVLDTGIDPHPDLNVYTNMAISTESTRDINGHGTAMAGIIGAKDNGFGVVGVAPGVRLWNIKLTDDPGTVSTPFFMSYVAAGMNFVLQHSNRISVVNMSFATLPNGAGNPFNSMRGGINRLVNAGIVVVAGVGNWTNDIAGLDGKFGLIVSDPNLTDDTIPAAFPQVMAVSGVDPTVDTFALYSNFNQIQRTNNSYPGLSNYVFSPGGAIDVAAPSQHVIRLMTNGGYEPKTNGGTSSATAHVTGLVALYIAANGRATNAEGVYRIRQAIVNASLPQSQWNTNNTMDPDTNPEPLAIASEAWIPHPVITNHSGAPGAFQLGFDAVPGYDYAVQSKTNLAPPVAWANVSTVSGTNFVGRFSVTDTNVAPQNFYRLERKSSTAAPTIVAQPQNLQVPVGSNAFLNVSVAGHAPFSFQWHRDGMPIPDAGNVSGTTTASLTLSNVQPADAASYSVVITNEHGSVASLVAAVTVLTNWTSEKVTGVLATATSEFSAIGRHASNTVSGAIGIAVWESVGVAQPQGNDPAPAITFDLGATRALERTQIWSGPEPGPAARRLAVEVSEDGISFHRLGEFTLSTLSPESESLSLGGVVTRYVRFVFQENGNGQVFPAGYAAYDGTGYIMLDEVEFQEYANE